VIRINFAGRLHRVYVGVDGLVHWGAYAGSGGILGFKGGLSDLGQAAELAAKGEAPDNVEGHLGAAAPGLTVVGGLAVCPEVWTDGNRLSFEARWVDGKARQKVMSADTFAAIQDWQVIDTEPAELPVAGEPGPAGPPGQTVTDVHIAEVAVAAMRAELQKLL
jgi:hypothetical protein